MLYGLLNLSLWGYVVAVLILTQITVAGISLYLHRCQAHCAITLHPIVSHFFRFWLWLTSGMVTGEWVAVHRCHHAHSDMEGDPHSPVLYGIKKVFWQGAELYRKSARDKALVERYAHGTPDDWIERNLYRRYSTLGIMLMFVLDVVLFGVPGITVWALQMMWTPLFAAGIINGIGHYWGYRNFECPDAARNIWPIAIFTAGEELHNNHHTYGTSAKFSVKWWEFDLGWFYICILRAFGLAKVKRVPPKPYHVLDKVSVDVDTLKAIIANRFQIMSAYAKCVILPVFREELMKADVAAKNHFKRCKRLLIRERSLVKPTDTQRLEKALEHREKLRLVYQYRLTLQDIWSHTTATHKELIEAVQEWCREAEATGIKVLQEFAHRLKGYTVRPV